jgi:hypothetical protein
VWLNAGEKNYFNWIWHKNIFLRHGLILASNHLMPPGECHPSLGTIVRLQNNINTLMPEDETGWEGGGSGGEVVRETTFRGEHKAFWLWKFPNSARSSFR